MQNKDKSNFLYHKHTCINANKITYKQTYNALHHRHCFIFLAVPLCMAYTYMYNALHHLALLYITCCATLYDIQTYIHTCIMPSTTGYCFIFLAVPPCMTYKYTCTMPFITQHCFILLAVPPYIT